MIFRRSPLENERARLLTLAQSLICCRPLAEQAVKQAFREYLRSWEGEESISSPALLVTILTGKNALTYASRYQKKIPAQLLPPPAEGHPEDFFMRRIGPVATGMLLLCNNAKMTVEEAATLLNIPKNVAQRQYQTALEALGETVTGLEDAVKELQRRVETYWPKTRPQAGGKRVRYKLAVAIFALLDITCLLSAVSLYTWSHSFLMGFETTPIQQTVLTEITALPSLENAASLDHLFYEVTALPKGFRKTAHIRTEAYARYQYADNAGNSIAFTQQLSMEPVMGFSSTVKYEAVSFRGHTAALHIADGLMQLFWFNEYYCYTLTTNLGKEATLALAESARIGRYSTQEIHTIPLRELPMLYTPRLSLENNDIQIGISSSKNTEQINRFLESQESKEADAIRIVAFEPNGNTIITDLETSNGLIYCTRDSRRAKSGVRQEKGAEYRQARIVWEKGEHVLLLENGMGEAAFAAATYP